MKHGSALPITEAPSLDQVTPKDASQGRLQELHLRHAGRDEPRGGKILGSRDNRHLPGKNPGAATRTAYLFSSILASKVWLPDESLMTPFYGNF